jgi:hypothetical protein
MQVSLRRRDGLVAEKLLREEQVSGLAPEVARRPAQAQLTSALLDDRWHFKGHSRTLGHLRWSGLSPFSLTIDSRLALSQGEPRLNGSEGSFEGYSLPREGDTVRWTR